MNSQISLFERLRLWILRLLLRQQEYLLMPFVRKGYLLELGWFTSVTKNQSVDRFGKPVPWITYPATVFLEGRTFPNMNVFEYGAGNSTLFFRNKGLKVFSVEHDEQWYNYLITQGYNPEFLYHQKIDDQKGIKAYVEQVHEPGLSFDVVLVDGRHRQECMIEASAALNNNGVIILDNSERKHYQAGIDYLHSLGFKSIDFYGLSPIAYKASCTSIFYRKDNLLNI